MNFPDYRPRRLRKNENFRRMIRETALSVDDLVSPLFVIHGRGVKNPISSMPGNFQLSIDNLVEEVKKIQGVGIPAIMLFGIPEAKDEEGSGAWAEDGMYVFANTRAMATAGYSTAARWIMTPHWN